MNHRAIFIASTGQHVGKTTTCLGLVGGLSKRFPTIGFMKPVGQEHVETATGAHVDKDVILFKDYFHLSSDEEAMSPVLLPRGFTRDYLDNKVNLASLHEKIHQSFQRLYENNEITIIEGTGHCGVGSIVELNNAQVAAMLQIPIILVASGGLGSTFDDLTLNHTLCKVQGAKVAGIILNRVLPEKREMIEEYMKKALKRWNVPLLGCIPYDAFLSNPSMKDFESLFNTTLLSGEEHQMRHFRHTRLVATSLENYQNLISHNQLVITPANREDIILATLSKYWDIKIENPKDDIEAGMILTGSTPPKHSIVEQLKKAHIPMLYAPMASYAAMKMLTTYTVKIRKEDVAKIKEAVDLVERHIDFDTLISILGNGPKDPQRAFA
ncbi:MAG: AAA family ATPase [Simkania sp.]|nr:AAA family ATPase [Simkania sp.]